MSPYVTFLDTDKNGVLQYYILQREFPHYVGIVVDKMEDAVFVGQPVLGYNLWVIFAGTIRGAYIPSYPDVKKEIDAVFLNMTDWFYKNRVLINPKKYKKYVQASVQ